VAEVSKALTAIFALYVKTKNFHWHMSGAHFRDYHLLPDEESAQIFATTDPIAERVRKIGGTTLRSIGQIGLRRCSPRAIDPKAVRLRLPPSQTARGTGGKAVL
jgi:starvation-inducible DNA-binding protein